MRPGTALAIGLFMPQRIEHLLKNKSREYGWVKNVRGCINFVIGIWLNSSWRELNFARFFEPIAQARLRKPLP